MRFVPRPVVLGFVNGLAILIFSAQLPNVVGGNIKSLLPPPNALSLPVVAWGGAALLAWPDVDESVRAELSWGGEPVTVTVWSARADRETATLGRDGKGHLS